MSAFAAAIAALGLLVSACGGGFRVVVPPDPSSSGEGGSGLTGIAGQAGAGGAGGAAIGAPVAPPSDIGVGVTR